MDGIFATEIAELERSWAMEAQALSSQMRQNEIIKLKKQLYVAMRMIQRYEVLTGSSGGAAAAEVDVMDEVSRKKQ